MKITGAPVGSVVAQRIDMSDETTREVRHVYRRKVGDDGRHSLTQIIGIQQRAPGCPPRYRARQADGPVYRVPGILPVMTISELRAKARKGTA